ncbi:MAG: glycosyltransferase involved in cell wall biosynthesis [Myxococcota bacterium]|jgi:glycosyltransferase involved in cell wall biosynthesis
MMIDREQLTAWRAAAPGFLKRQAKHLQQARYGWDHRRQVSFVFGCQRSGTKMVMWVLDKSPATRIYHENHAAAFRDFQLRPDPVVRALVHTSPAPAQIFKPICDSQRADEILDHHPHSRGLWIYRDPGDVANSAVHKWGDHQLEVVAAAARGEAGDWGWRTADLPESVQADLRRVYRDDLTPHEGALLFWYMRNAFFFALGLDRDPRMRLVCYEHLVQQPEAAFRPLFTHTGVPFERRFVEAVRDSSIGRRPAPPARPEIAALIEGLKQRLEAWRPPAGLPSPILILIDTLGVGGAERYAVTIANWMARRGVAVTLAAESGEQTAGLDEAVRFEPLPLRHLRAGIPAAALSIRRLLRERQPVAIVTNSLAVTWIARLARAGRRIPIVNVAHGWPAHRYALVGPLMRAADVVVAVSPDVRARLVAGGLPPERCEVIYNGVNCDPLGRRTGPARTAARAEMGADEDNTLVLVVGRLSDQKAHQHVVIVAEKLREVHPELRFAIVGDGEREEELAALIETHSVGDRLVLMGQRSDVPELLGSADIYLSTSDWEGMPLATIEAMASALPIVSTHTEGADQLLTDDCSLVVPVADPDAIAEAIGALAGDPARRLALGAAARKRALADFSHDRMTRQLTALIARIIAT